MMTGFHIDGITLHVQFNISIEAGTLTLHPDIQFIQQIGSYEF